MKEKPAMVKPAPKPAKASKQASKPANKPAKTADKPAPAAEKVWSNKAECDEAETRLQERLAQVNLANQSIVLV